MPINILMPALSPTMEAGNLARWLKKEGDPVKPGDVIAEIETDKATMEVEAIDEGRLARILVPEGTQDVKVNAPIAVLLEEGEDASAIGDAPAPTAPTKKETPAAGGADTAPPAKAAAPRPPAAAATEKPAPAAPSAPASAKANGGGRVFASPLARRLAKEGGIDLSALAGSGPHGRVIKADIEAARTSGAPAAKAAPSPAAAPAPPAAGDEQVLKLFEAGSYELVPHDNMRKIIARRLVEAKNTIPHFYLTMDCEIDALLALRADVNGAAPLDREKSPLWKVSVNDMVIKALAMALHRVPDANVSWTDGGMLRHKHADIGVAVAIPGGLITPVVRRADEKRISEIAAEMKDLAARARTRKLAPHEYQGGSSAVSNLGMFGVKDFAAVINPPHATILAVGAGEERAVVRKGKIEVATVMTVTLSTDHRAVDGALGAQLLSAFKALIEKPAGMLA